MNEEKQETKEESKEETTPKGETTPDTDQSPIEKGEKILKGIDEGMKKYEALVIRQEEAAARMLVGGKGEAGEAIKSPEEEADAKIDAEVAETLKAYD